MRTPPSPSRRSSPAAVPGAVLAIVLAVLALGPVLPRAAEPRAVRPLEDLVRQDCGSCHGLTLKGGLGPPLLPAALDGKPAEALAEVILDGIPGTPMPPWRGLLDDGEARRIAAMLKKGLAP
ncbi:c-type cytochrome [Prosthecodimorpha staleyi]|uniref:Cytochrome c n=1 Tax=Prosthecodimorpha staleyi TaxID=2840188 RepID=A0A947D9L9_9HYPH|nr:cytochrome c [Prosthecodimorpha staleyi]MBT9293063.1 cytochrome c [Prosthecodimorpha staleyi]